jgi:hypothetical protein
LWRSHAAAADIVVVGIPASLLDTSASSSSSVDITVVIFDESSFSQQK